MNTISMPLRVAMITLLLGSQFLSFAQTTWQTSGTNIYNLNTGNVGIGTTAPSVALEVHGVGALAFTAGASQEMTRLYSNTGNGSQIRFTTNRFAAGSSWTSASTRMQAWTDLTPQAYIEFNPNGGTYAMAFGNNNVESMRFTSTGNLLIGKTTQVNSTYLLDINGNARANEVVVNTTGADFVFDSTYHLPDLSMVAAYIKTNHHLPQIRSAAEMEKDGLNLGEDQIRLLQKIEELTLYTIKQNKELEELKLQNQRLEDRNRALETLEQRVQRLESLERSKASSKH